MADDEKSADPKPEHPTPLRGADEGVPAHPKGKVPGVGADIAALATGLKTTPGERYAKTYEINMLRCIFCGYCEDACPVQAIVLGPEYELSDTSREKFIYTKEKLLEPLPPDVEARLKAGTPSPPPNVGEGKAP